MRADIDLFHQAGATVLAIAPETLDGVARFVRDSHYPFAILSDNDHRVFDAYDVASKLMSLGQRPAVFIVDRGGIVRYDSIGVQQWQIPANESVFAVLSSL